MKSPIKGCRISCSFAQGDRLRHELYIDSGEGARNAELFEQLSAQQGQLEAVYERELSWEELPNKKASRVADYKDGCAVTAVERHDEFIDWFFDAGIRLRAALKTVSIA